MTSIILDHRARPDRPTRWRNPRLLTREQEVLVAWVRSGSKTAVGTQLSLSVGTIDAHLARIRDKYAAVGRAAETKAALVARALQDGLIVLDDL
ncbi:LuxR family transcriptional regulator [Nocardia altamirensis]|uniref:LuxR family transcriptional regulator n=1 Tax=Nocardia altamirensis TaxID=472158 RepID=UPI00083FDFEE|nr:LuxR family transcriptional regulator [Nocardia altamirensis]